MVVNNSQYRVTPNMLETVDGGGGFMLDNLTQMRSINELEAENYMPNTFDAMVAVIGPTKIAENGDDGKDYYYSNRYGRGQKNSIQYDRLMHFWCFNGNPGRNHFEVYLGKGQNTMFFGAASKYRDSMYFCK